MAEIRVLFVCLGNICRSPLAEALFKDKVQKQGLHQRIQADSCGTGNYHIGDQPDRRTQASARKHGITMDHRARQFDRSDLDEFDYILAMDRANFRHILRLADEERHHQKIVMMRRFDPRAEHEDVPDPYFGGEEGFQDVFDILDRSTSNFLAYLCDNHLR